MCCLNINAYVTGIWLCLCTSRTPRELPQATTLDNRASMAHLVDEQGMGAWEWVPGRDREMERGEVGILRAQWRGRDQFKSVGIRNAAVGKGEARG